MYSCWSAVDRFDSGVCASNLLVHEKGRRSGSFCIWSQKKSVHSYSTLWLILPKILVPSVDLRFPRNWKNTPVNYQEKKGSNGCNELLLWLEIVLPFLHTCVWSSIHYGGDKTNQYIQQLSFYHWGILSRRPVPTLCPGHSVVFDTGKQSFALPP